MWTRCPSLRDCIRPLQPACSDTIARRPVRVRKFIALTLRFRRLNSQQRSHQRSRPREKHRAAIADVRARTRSHRSGTPASRHHVPTKNAARRARCVAACATRRSPPLRHIGFANAPALRRTPARRPAPSSRDRFRRHDKRRYARRTASVAAEETSSRAFRTQLRRFWTGRRWKSCSGGSRHHACPLVRVRLRGTMSALFRVSASFVS